jgi:hypothetical protein
VIANEVINWRISTSFRLLGIPHKKNRPATSAKALRLLRGTSGFVSLGSDSRVIVARANLVFLSANSHFAASS